MYGIHINGRGNTFRADIENHKKIQQTRARRTLDKYTAERVGLIETGSGKAVLWGFCKLDMPTVYSTVKAFRKAYRVHRVAKGTTFDIKKGGKKYGYPISGLVLLKHPVVLPAQTFDGNRTARILPEEFSEKVLTQYIL